MHSRAAKFIEAHPDGEVGLTNHRLSTRRLALALVVLICHTPAVMLGTSCVKLPRRAHSSQVETLTTSPSNTQSAGVESKHVPLININRASREELAQLPGIGAGLAARIVEHRERYGAFRRAEHLLMVRGISERRFEQLRAQVSVE